jgi:hypothetical protein
MDTHSIHSRDAVSPRSDHTAGEQELYRARSQIIGIASGLKISDNRAGYSRRTDISEVCRACAVRRASSGGQTGCGGGAFPSGFPWAAAKDRVAHMGYATYPGSKGRVYRQGCLGALTARGVRSLAPPPARPCRWRRLPPLGAPPAPTREGSVGLRGGAACLLRAVR